MQQKHYYFRFFVCLSRPSYLKIMQVRPRHKQRISQNYCSRFTGQMHFLSTNQQQQSTEGNCAIKIITLSSSLLFLVVWLRGPNATTTSIWSSKFGQHHKVVLTFGQRLPISNKLKIPKIQQNSKPFTHRKFRKIAKHLFTVKYQPEILFVSVHSLIYNASSKCLPQQHRLMSWVMDVTGQWMHQWCVVQQCAERSADAAVKTLISSKQNHLLV